jgi:hypothetical protein
MVYGLNRIGNLFQNQSPVWFRYSLATKGREVLVDLSLPTLRLLGCPKVMIEQFEWETSEIAFDKADESGSCKSQRKLLKRTVMG